MTRPTVLVVDDEPDMLDVIATFLGAEHRVIAVSDVAAARAALATEPCDVVVTDIRMPGESGLGLIDEIRATRAHLPIVVVSASEEFHPELVCRWLSKPFRRADLLEAVRQALAERR